MVDPPTTLSFCEKMKRLLSHCLPLKEWMKDYTISYLNLFRLDPLPSRLDDDPVPQGSKWLALQKQNE